MRVEPLMLERPPPASIIEFEKATSTWARTRRRRWFSTGFLIQRHDVRMIPQALDEVLGVTHRASAVQGPEQLQQGSPELPLVVPFDPEASDGFEADRHGVGSLRPRGSGGRRGDMVTGGSFFSAIWLITPRSHQPQVGDFALPTHLSSPWLTSREVFKSLLPLNLSYRIDSVSSDRPETVVTGLPSRPGLAAGWHREALRAPGACTGA